MVLDKLDYCATVNNLQGIADLPNFKFVKGSIQSFDLIAHLLESEEIDTVMHFAAQVRCTHTATSVHIKAANHQTHHALWSLPDILTKIFECSVVSHHEI